MLEAKKSCVLTGPGERPFHQAGRRHHAAGDADVARLSVVERRGVARVVVARGDFVKEGPRLIVADQQPVGGVQVVRSVCATSNA